MFKEDPLIESAKPEIDELSIELYRSRTDERVNGRVLQQDSTRYATWSGQTIDGRKHTKNYGKQVHPWEGASDSRIFLADEYCDWYVSLLTAADARSVMNVDPIEFKDSENASSIQAYMSWLLSTALQPNWEDELELVKQYSATYGWSGVHVKWNRSYQMRPMVLTMESLAKFIGVDDPDAVGLAETLVNNIDLLTNVLSGQLPGVKKKDIKKSLQELAADGKTTIDKPGMVSNYPEIIALKPYSELLFPPETRDIQRARVIFRRDTYTATEIDDMVNTAGWNKEWAEEIKKTAGHNGHWEDIGTNTRSGDYYGNDDGRENMVEVIHAYSRRTDAAGVPGVYQTVFSPHFTKFVNGGEAYGSHTLVTEAAGKYPINVFTRERTTREVVDSRGIPEITRTWQAEYKGEVDMMFDRSNLETLPPLKVPQRYGNRIVIGPGKQLSEQRPGDISWMEPPRKGPEVALNNIAAIETRADRYFGRNHPDVDPFQNQVKQQYLVDRWLRFKSVLIQDVWALVQRFGDDQQFSEVTGTGQPIPRDPNRHNFALSFDVRDIDGEFTQKKLDAVAKIVLPADVMGVLDRRKLIEAMLRAVDPTMPNELMVDNAEASQAMFNDVRNEVAQMALGNVPNFTESDPAAETKLQFLQQIIQGNPKYQEALQGDERFAELLEAFLKNLTMSVQQDRNAQTGRLGVDAASVGQ